MVFSPEEKDMLLTLITIKQSKIAAEQNETNEEVIQKWETIKQKVKRL